MKKNVNQENINQFDGISELYNATRPIPPEIIVKAIILYLKKTPDTVIDIGSGTGMSTQIWSSYANTIIGIEPNADMRREASKTIESGNVSFVDGVSNDTGLEPSCADVVTVAQAFHWFDIDSTLNEVYRILKNGGVFAVYDCELLPSFNWNCELFYNNLRKKCDVICANAPNPSVKNDRSTYVSRFNDFGRFRFVKEVVCHNVEKSTPERMRGIILSQGVIQLAMKLDDTIINEVKALCSLVESQCCHEFDIICSYRIRLGVK